MAWNTDDFCDAWLNGTLKRKKQHGGYYVQDFNSFQFLCYYNKDEYRSSNPLVLAMRCLKTNLVFTDQNNFGGAMPQCVALDYNKRKQIVYTTRFAALDQITGDLAEIKLIDTKYVNSRDGRMTLALYDINGSKYYTDLFVGSLCHSRRDYLERGDFMDVPAERKIITRLTKTNVGCSKIDDARKYSIPAEVGDRNFVTINDFILVPDEKFSPEIPREIIRVAKWRPTGVGWGLPASIIDTEGTIKWEWSRIAASKDKEKFMKKVKKDWPKDRKLHGDAEVFLGKYREWREAVDYVEERNCQPSDLGYSTLEFSPDEASKSVDGGIYVNGKVSEWSQDRVNVNINLRGAWHKIIRKGT